MSINISGDHIQETNFATHLEHQLQAYPNFSPGQLQIEILETIALNDFEQVSNTMAACQKLGISFALDDFGTGYSSLTYLRNLPTETIKIDQSFVRDMLEDDGDYAIVKGVLALSDTFKRKTVAEGIETEAQFQALKVMNCHSGQGYLFAQPMPAKDFLVWYHASKLS